MKKIARSIAAIISFVFILSLALIIYFNFSLPSKFYVETNKNLVLDGAFSAIECNAIDSGNVAIVSNSDDKNMSQNNYAKVMFLGVIPIKTVEVLEIETPSLIPCGEPFGIKLLTDGVMVVEVSSFQTGSGVKSPAVEAGIRAGDIIKTIDGIFVYTNSQIGEIISDSGGDSLTIEYSRDDIERTTNLDPLKSVADDCYKAGIWVRDSSAGIGTMTYYNPITKEFAGLGHPICDVDTGKIMPISSGEVVKVGISGVKKGEVGSPGELMGGFLSLNSAGSLEVNSKSGVFGHLYNFTPQNEALPIGLSQEIEIGKAYIYSTVLGTKPEKYEIEIDKINFSNKDKDDCKNLVITVTDKDLLDKTGGIVQGMSGSPIIQNGKIIGAVTHVFVKDPTRGYGIFIESMLESVS